MFVIDGHMPEIGKDSTKQEQIWQVPAGFHEALQTLHRQKEVQVETKQAAELKSSDWHLGRPKLASRGRASTGYPLEQWSSAVITSSSISTTFI